jgi:hypothetical protein
MPHDPLDRPALDHAHDLDPTARDAPTRRRFLGTAGVAAAAAAGTFTAGSGAAHAQFEFGGGISALRQHFREIQANENAHRDFVRQALGSDAFGPPPLRNIQQPLYRDFAARSRLFENTGTKALLGAAPLIDSRDLLFQATAIALIEARQAGWLNTLFPGFALMEGNERIESPISALQAAQRIAPYFADPNLPLQLAGAIRPEPSPENDIAILRFFLANEYLESTFYNVNVPRFLS